MQTLELIFYFSHMAGRFRQQSVKDFCRQNHGYMTEIETTKILQNTARCMFDIFSHLR